MGPGLLARPRRRTGRGRRGAPDYAAVADGPSAVLSSTVPRPAGSAALVQAVYADDYRAVTITVSGELSGDLVTRTGRPAAGDPPALVARAATREDHGRTIAGRRPDWTGHEITARIPADADIIRFGIGLDGTGRIGLRHPNLRVIGPEAGTA